MKSFPKKSESQKTKIKQEEFLKSYKWKRLKLYPELLWEKRKEDLSYLRILKRDYPDFYKKKIREQMERNQKV